VTESERYEKRTTTANGKKKSSPQEVWMDLIATSIESAPPHLTQHLDTMASLGNVPRKEKQFRNFTKNSLRLDKRDAHTIVDEVWQFLQGLRAQQRTASTVPEKVTATNSDPLLVESNETKRKVHDKEKSSTKFSTSTEHCEGDTSALSEKIHSAINSNVSTSVSRCSTNSISPPPAVELTKMAVDKTTVKKTMKKILKKVKMNRLELKYLRKAVCEKLGAHRSLVKDLVQKNLNDSKRFIIDGKEVILKVD
jgi:hypothetical protein